MYLGHIINTKLDDDNDIQREIRNSFMRTNTLFAKIGIAILKFKYHRNHCIVQDL